MPIGPPAMGSPLAGHTYAISSHPQLPSSPSRRHEQSSPTANSVWCPHRRTAGSVAAPDAATFQSNIPMVMSYDAVYTMFSACGEHFTRRTAYWCPRTVASGRLGLRTSHIFTVLSTPPVAMTQSLYLFQSQVKISYSCAGIVSVECGCRTSQIFKVQSPDAVANTSACCGDHTAAYTQYACSANVRSDPGALGFVADGGA
mmetsp:Transcript_12986/g.54511  ORF Transcript_12986/g.54511 Transcript_12986/m.54511 type:complete len:201 (-) Transcript_12986:483-1085(-)